MRAGIVAWLAVAWNQPISSGPAPNSAVSADVVIAAERELDNELQAAHAGMNRATRDGYYLRGEDQWRHEIEVFERDLRRAESRTVNRRNNKEFKR